MRVRLMSMHRGVGGQPPVKRLQGNLSNPHYSSGPRRSTMRQFIANPLPCSYRCKARDSWCSKSIRSLAKHQYTVRTILSAGSFAVRAPNSGVWWTINVNSTRNSKVWWTLDLNSTLSSEVWWTIDINSGLYPERRLQYLTTLSQSTLEEMGSSSRGFPEAQRAVAPEQIT